MPSADAHAGLAAAARLKRLAAALASGSPPPSEDAVWLAGRLGVYLAAEGEADLDGVLGLLPPPGGSSWRTLAKHSERDRLIRELGSEMPGSTHARAVVVQSQMRRYAGTAWPRDRVAKQSSAANAALFAIFSLDPDPPTGIRRLTDIIGG